MKEKMIAYKQAAGKTMKAIFTVIKVLFYEILIVLVAFGILYATNFKLSITKNVQVISPLVETK